MDAVFGGVCLIAGGLLMALLMGWRAPDRFSADLQGSGTSPRLLQLLRWGLRWVSVPVISLGLVVSVVDLVKSWSAG
jgi:NSS family neurotransmitter:Na+ symporter